MSKVKYRGTVIDLTVLKRVKINKTAIGNFYKTWSSMALNRDQVLKLCDGDEEKTNQIMEWSASVSRSTTPPFVIPDAVTEELGYIRALDLVTKVLEDTHQPHEARNLLGLAVGQVKEALEESSRLDAEKRIKAFMEKDGIAELAGEIRKYEDIIALAKSQRDDKVAEIESLAKKEVSPLASWWGDTVVIVDTGKRKTDVPSGLGRPVYREVYPTKFKTRRDDVGLIQGTVHQLENRDVRCVLFDDKGNKFTETASHKERSPASYAVKGAINQCVNHHYPNGGGGVVSYAVKRVLLKWDRIDGGPTGEIVKGEEQATTV